VKKTYSTLDGTTASVATVAESHEGFALFNLKQTAEDYLENEPRDWIEFEGEH
jgi:hypothetical protein